MKGLQIIVTRAPARPSGVEVYLSRYDREAGAEMAKVEWVPCNVNSYHEPALQLNEREPDVTTALQSLANQLWSLGYRPSEAQMSDTAVKAKDAHLSALTSILDRVLPSALKK